MYKIADLKDMESFVVMNATEAGEYGHFIKRMEENGETAVSVGSTVISREDVSMISMEEYLQVARPDFMVPQGENLIFHIRRGEVGRSRLGAISNYLAEFHDNKVIMKPR